MGEATDSCATVLLLLPRRLRNPYESFTLHMIGRDARDCVIFDGDGTALSGGGYPQIYLRRPKGPEPRGKSRASLPLLGPWLDGSGSAVEEQVWVHDPRGWLPCGRGGADNRSACAVPIHARPR